MFKRLERREASFHLGEKTRCIRGQLPWELSFQLLLLWRKVFQPLMLESIELNPLLMQLSRVSQTQWFLFILGCFVLEQHSEVALHLHPGLQTFSVGSLPDQRAAKRATQGLCKIQTLTGDISLASDDLRSCWGFALLRYRNHSVSTVSNIFMFFILLPTSPSSFSHRLVFLSSWYLPRRCIHRWQPCFLSNFALTDLSFPSCPEIIVWFLFCSSFCLS